MDCEKPTSNYFIESTPVEDNVPFSYGHCCENYDYSTWGLDEQQEADSDCALCEDECADEDEEKDMFAM